MLYNTDYRLPIKAKKFKILGRYGRQNMLRLYLKIWDQDLIFGQFPHRAAVVRAVQSYCT